MQVHEWTSVRRRLARAGVGLMVGLSAIGLAACGSDSGDAGAATAAAPAKSDAAKDAAIAELTKRPTRIAVSEPIGKPVPSGKTITLVPTPIIDPKPSLKILEEAAAVLGWKANMVVPTNSSTAALGQAIDEAVRQQTDAIVMVSFPGSALRAPIGRAADAGIPVVNMNASEPAGSVPGITAQPLGQEYLLRVAEKTGEMMGLLVPEGSTVGEAALLVITKADAIQQATEKGVKTTCPSCSYKPHITLAAQAKDYVPNMVNFIRKEELAGLYIMNGPLSNGLGPAMRATGIDPSSVAALAGTINGADGSAARVQKGEAPLAAGYVWPAAEGLWYGVDAAARALAGVSAKASETTPDPYIVLPGEVPADVLENPTTTTVLDYKAQCAELWGK